MLAFILSIVLPAMLVLAAVIFLPAERPNDRDTPAERRARLDHIQRRQRTKRRAWREGRKR